VSAPDIVIVSAHLDDGVLSATAQLVRPGARLLTVFAGEPAAGAPLGAWDRLTGASDAAKRVRERYDEDDAAAWLLGATTRRLDFPDAQHIPSGTPRIAHHVMVAALRVELAGATEVWAPAGIGCHPDHLATRDAAVAATPPGAVVHHYADVPYSVPYGWPPSVTGADPMDLLDVEWWLADALAGTGLATGGLTRLVHRLDDDTRRRKVAAMACYATQLAALDPGRVLTDGDPLVAGFEVSWSRA
jgi:LmbE family N-acetylglucosaminyl deacetylase